jgi:hypothetical protein
MLFLNSTLSSLHSSRWILRVFQQLWCALLALALRAQNTQKLTQIEKSIYSCKGNIHTFMAFIHMHRKNSETNINTCSFTEYTHKNSYAGKYAFVLKLNVLYNVYKTGLQQSLSSFSPLLSSSFSSLEIPLVFLYL